MSSMRITIFFMFVGILSASPGVFAAPTVTQITLMSEKRVARTVFEYVYKITVKNDATALKGAVAKLTTVGSGTSIIEDRVVIGDLAANAIANPADTFTIRHDRAIPFQANALIWSFSSNTPGNIGKDVVFVGPPPIPVARLNSLPRNPETNRPILISINGAQLEFDGNLRDPISAVGACTAWISACYDPGTREIDDCARSAPTCKTNQPWLEATSCCPSGCFDAYRSKRLNGANEIDTYFEVYFMDGSCFPGFKGGRAIHVGD